MQILRVAALLLGAAASVLGVGSGLAVANVAQNQDRALSAALDQQAAKTDEYFRRTSSAVMLSTQNPAFADVYTDIAPGLVPRSDQLAGRPRERVVAALTQVETLLQGQVQKSCLVDVGGAVLVCVVDGRSAPAAYLTPSLQNGDVLTATLSQPAGTVYQGRPYRSPELNDWVVPTSAVVRDGMGRARAVLQFEVALDALRSNLTSTAAGERVEIVDAADGAVLVDASRTVTTPTSTTDATPSAARRDTMHYQVTGWKVRGHEATVGRSVSYQRLTGSSSAATNANDWFMVVSSPQPPVGWRSSTDFGPVGTTLLGLFLLGLSAAGFVQHGRSLARRALLDELTGLANRQALYARLERALATDDAQAVMIIDLDRFKTVNDTLGHFAGDILLAEVGRRFAELCPAGDLVARLGGDEFGYLISASDGGDPLVQARALVYALETPILVEGSPVQVGCSVGIALLGEHGDDVATLVRRADLAMYEAKRRRTGVAMFDPGLERRNTAGLTFETSLLHALERHELVLHYQPQIDIGTGEVSGVEALVRWQHPELGLLGPDRFIPLAEETGLIVGLTKHVLAMALDQALAWSLDGNEIPVAVNLAARNVADPRLPSDVAQMLAERGLPAWILRLELTETDLLGDPEQARTVLQELTALGVDLAVDDFGTGFASLSQLRKLPFKELKIDRSFVAVLEGDPEAVHIVDSIVDLAHGLGLRVTAEGVETLACLDVLRSVGCDVAQGYLFSKPLPPDDALAWIRRHDPLTVARKQPAAMPLARAGQAS